MENRGGRLTAMGRELRDGVPGIAVLTHGRAGEELIRSAEMIMGHLEAVVAVPLLPGDAFQDYQEKTERVMNEMPRGSLMLTDLFAGTPCNCAAVILRRIPGSAAVSGLSLAILIEAANLRGRFSGEELAEAVVAAGKDSIRNVSALLREHEAVSRPPEEAPE